MKEEELNELVKEHYGFTIDEIDEDVGRLSLRVNQLEYNNKKIQQENKSLQSQLKAKEEVIKEAREYANKEIRFVNMQEYENLLEILSKGENK